MKGNESEKKQDIEKSNVAKYLPHRQLFKPKNFIESIFVGLSIFSVIVLILSNIVNIDDSLKSLAPKFIVDNFPQIMHFAHIVLIVYVIIAMRNMFELIKDINEDKETYNKRIKQPIQFKEEIDLINESVTNIKNLFLAQDSHIIAKKIDEEKEKFENRAIEKTVKSAINSIIKEEGKTNRERWKDWIEKYINVSEDKKKYDVHDINRNIYIANDNLTLFYRLWLCVWGAWLLLYTSMFIFGFMERHISDPLNSRYSITMNDVLILKDDKSKGYYARTDIPPKGDSHQDQLRLYPDYKRGTAEYNISDIRDKNIVIFSSAIESVSKKEIGVDSICSGTPDFFFFNWYAESDKKYRIICKSDSLVNSDNLTYIKSEDCLKSKDATATATATVATATATVTVATADSVATATATATVATAATGTTTLNAKALGMGATNTDTVNVCDRVPIDQVKKGVGIEQNRLKDLNFTVHDMSTKRSTVNIFVFIENTIGNVINLFFFLLYYLLSYNYMTKKTIRQSFEKDYPNNVNKNAKGNAKYKNCKNTKECSKYDDCKKCWNCEKNKRYSSYERDRNRFKWFLGIMIGIVLLIIAVDYYVTIGQNKEYLKVYAQLAVSTLCCVSMLFLFGQMNNGCLRLPPLAVWVMYFYAAVQLFAPFRGIWIMSDKFIASDTFSFFVTTLCFISKFMVFFIIRWLFTEGRIAYYFINESYTGREIPEYKKIFKIAPKT